MWSCDYSSKYRTLPFSSAERYDGLFSQGSRLLPVPLNDIAINLFWHAQVNRDAANQWRRGVLVGLFGVSNEQVSA
jgi:hypothetical protein